MPETSLQRGGLLSGRPVYVVGGGIGGLAAALAFARRGAAVTVLEQAEAFTEVGAGLQITPNGMRVLSALGLESAIAEASIEAGAVEPMNGLTGRKITRFDLAGRTPPFRFVHRADLVNVLEQGCREAGVDLRLGTKVTERPEAELVVAADGVHSALRASATPRTEPFFTGQVAFRAVVENVENAEPVARVWMGPGRHIVTYPLRGNRLNIVAVQERSEWRADGWNHAADPVAMRAAFADFSGRISGWLSRVEAASEWGLFRYEIAEKWHDGQGLALIGDAAHPTLPFLAQGANLALEDAWVLADCTDKMPLAEALPAYQSLRKARVTRAISEANANARRYHQSGLLRPLSHVVLAGIGTAVPNWWMRRLDWLYGHDVTGA